MSVKTGDGFDAYQEFLSQQGQFGTRALEMDYDLYAEGEAELGWLNCQFRMSSDSAIKLDQLLLQLVTDLHNSLATSDAEIAHLKAIGMEDGSYAVANSVSSSTEPELSLMCGTEHKAADIVVNARVAIDPEQLESLVREKIQEVTSKLNADARIDTMQSFRPGRPVPTHRIVAS